VEGVRGEWSAFSGIWAAVCEREGREGTEAGCSEDTTATSRELKESRGGCRSRVAHIQRHLGSGVRAWRPGGHGGGCSEDTTAASRKLKECRVKYGGRVWRQRGIEPAKRHAHVCVFELLVLQFSNDNGQNEIC
jgi:hypothetical protein